MWQTQPREVAGSRRGQGLGRLASDLGQPAHGLDNKGRLVAFSAPGNGSQIGGIGLDRLLVETDAPFLSPPGAPRGRNEPEWVAVTVRWLAECRDEDPDSLGATLVADYDRIIRGVAPGA